MQPIVERRPTCLLVDMNIGSIIHDGKNRTNSYNSAVNENIQIVKFTNLLCINEQSHLLPGEIMFHQFFAHYPQLVCLSFVKRIRWDNFRKLAVAEELPLSLAADVPQFRVQSSH